jgi:anti-sigma B factor antagonist
MPLDIQTLKNTSGPYAGATTVKLSGSLDTATAPELERAMGPVLDEAVTHIIYDLAGLKFVSSAGLRVFASTRKVLHSRNGFISFVNVQPQIQEVFNIIESLPGVSIFASIEELDRYLATRQRAINPNI